MLRMEQEKSFGVILRGLREARGLTLNQLAIYAGVSSGLISKLENGKRGTPKPDTIEKLAKALKMEYSDLMKLAGYVDADEPTSVQRKVQDEPDANKVIAEKLLSYLHQGLTNEEIRKRMDFIVDVFTASDAQADEFIDFVRAELKVKEPQLLNSSKLEGQ